MFDTTLRPGTLNKLSVPENWAPGEVPLTDQAIAALEAAAPKSGLIFGITTT
jgi:hypothetical protein